MILLYPVLSIYFITQSYTLSADCTNIKYFISYPFNETLSTVCPESIKIVPEKLIPSCRMAVGGCQNVFFMKWP
jgi:hypothetical protein